MWALLFLTGLAPSEKTNLANGKHHKTSIDCVGQMIAQVRRWLQERSDVGRRLGYGRPSSRFLLSIGMSARFACPAHRLPLPPEPDTCSFRLAQILDAVG
jgi:hypothetical protein